MPLDNTSIAAPAKLGRRGFITAAAALTGGLLIGITVPGRARAGVPAASVSPVTAWVSIGTDESVSILVGSSEMGQGIISGLPQVLAEELMVDWAKVTTAHAPAGAAYVNPSSGMQLTGGSNSMRGYFSAMLTAGAAARTMLVQAAAAAMGVTPESCTAASGVVSAPGGKSISYGQVAAAAALLPVPANPVILSSPGHYRLIGTPVARPDIPGKTNGSAIYGIDVVVPGMVYAAIAQCPAVGGTFTALPAAPAGTLGVVPVGKSAIAVVAHDTYTAIRAARSLPVKWSIPKASQAINSAAILSTAKTLMTTGAAVVGESSGDIAKAMAGAAKTLTLTYSVPYLPHACMEVLNCTVSITAAGCEIWAPTQAPGLVVMTAAAITGLPAAAIKVHTMFLGGGLGRKFEQDFIAQAVTVAKALGKPVKLTWSREQDFTHDQYRPFALCRVTAGLNADGSVAAWANRIVSPSILGQRGWVPPGGEDGQAVDGAVGQPYALGARLVDYVAHPCPVPVGFWRSVGNSYNAFVVESAIDELAKAAGMDPLAYRRKLLAGNTRALAVLNAAATLSGWGSAPAAGHARGIAYHESFGSIAAQVIEVTQTAATATQPAQIKLVRVSAAIDCGTAVNPDSVIAQVQSGVVHGLNAALWGRTTFSGGVASPENFDNYRMMRMRDMPRIDVTLVDTGGPIGGVGEVGVPCVAPALANAWAALTGLRVRDLPMFNGGGN